MRFLPREEKFFELFLQQVKLISEAANLLLQGAEAGNAHLEKAADKITVLEGRADSVLHEIFQRLNQTFITPLDPEDIHSLSTHLDDVIDGMEELAHRMVAYCLEPIPTPVVEGCREIVNCSRSLELAFQAPAVLLAAVDRFPGRREPGLLRFESGRRLRPPPGEVRADGLRSLQLGFRMLEAYQLFEVRVQVANQSFRSLPFADFSL